MQSLAESPKPSLRTPNSKSRNRKTALLAKGIQAVGEIPDLVHGILSRVNSSRAHGTV